MNSLIIKTVLFFAHQNFPTISTIFAFRLGETNSEQTRLSICNRSLEINNLTVHLISPPCAYNCWMNFGIRSCSNNFVSSSGLDSSLHPQRPISLSKINFIFASVTLATSLIRTILLSIVNVKPRFVASKT